MPVGDRTVTASADGYVQQDKPAEVVADATTTVDFVLERSPLEITTVSLPDAVVGDAYSATLEATGGTTPYTWAITTGSLPGGLSLDANTGIISGTPSVEGTWNFTAEMMDATADTVTQPLSITVTTAPVVDVTVVSVVARDIRYGRKYNIAATVRNDGLDGVTVRVDCGVEGGSGNETLATREVTIAPGESANVEFNDKSNLLKGAYAATVTVQEDPTASGSDAFQIK